MQGPLKKKCCHILVLLLLLCQSEGAFSQNPSDQQKLYYSCKVWGFVKYYHSNVSVCGVNWDSVLIHCLPLIKNAVTSSDFNNALDTMLLAAGPMTLSSSPKADTMKPRLKSNLHFGWINDPVFRHDVQTILDTIKNNFRPHAECWAAYNTYSATTSNYSFILFPNDDPMINSNTSTSFPDEWHRLLLLFKHWNIINYFNPNNGAPAHPCDSMLYKHVMAFDLAANDQQYDLLLRKFSSELQDGIAEAYTGDASYLFPYGPYSIKLLLKYIPGKYVVVNSPVTAIHVGDEIVSVDGLTTIQWEDSLKPYVSAGDSDAFRKSVASDMLCGTYSANINVVFKDSTGASHTLPMPRGQSPGNSYFSSYFPNDTLANVQWKHWTNCNTGYINLSTMQDSGVFSAYQNLRTCSTLILDLRCAYPVSYTYNTLANYMLPGPKAYSSFLFPDPTYPGTFSVGSNQAGYSGNPEPYAGKVILLLNEQTQFQSEDAALIFETLPHVLKIGSPTNASDGNEIYYSISQNLQAGFNGYAIYDALGDSLERVGILPDIVMYPTQTGIRHHRDELLERALTASCVTGIELLEKPLPCIRIYPNPSSGIVTLVASFIPGRKQLVIHTMLGETIYRASLLQDDSVIDLSAFPPGMYLFSVYNTDGTFSSNGKLLIH